MGKKYILSYLGCLVLLVGCRTPTKQVPVARPASPICFLQNNDSQRLLEYVQVLADTVNSYSIEEVVQPMQQARFVPFIDKHFEARSHQAYWGKIQLENRLPDAKEHHEWVLNFSNTFTQISLYKLGKNGTWTREDNGSFVPFDQKSFVPTRNGNLFKVLLPPGEQVTLYFKGESERAVIPPTFHAYVQPIDVFYDKYVDAKHWSTLFTGFLLMMLCYNLLNYGFIRDRSYLYYTGYLLMVLVYTAYSSDDLEDWLGDYIFAKQPAYFTLFKISLYLGLICYLAFIRSFLDLKHLLPKWDRYFHFLIWLSVPLMVLFVVLAFRYQFSYVIDDAPTLFYISLVSLSTIFLVYPLFKTKDPKGIFITVGIIVISLGFLMTLYSRIYQTPFTVIYLKIGTLFEILIFSMGLAYRQRQQEKAKQQADFALKESQLTQEKRQVEAQRLQDLNEFKNRFFTNITHEFRTPLTVILGMSEQLGKSETDAPRQKNISLIKRSGENLLRLINQILDLAKLESNTLKIDYIQGDVLTYLKYITESLHSLANAQNVMLRVESDLPKIVMDYDSERLLQIVHNLLSNAIKFTPSGGRVVLRVGLIHRQGLASLDLQVSDTGSGIPPEDIPNIFDRFFQANNLESAKAGGSGIGLSLTAELVKAMGGEISVESTFGAGTTFLVKLPVTNRAAFAEKSSESADENWNATHASTAIHSPKGMPQNDSSLPQILLIEDNPDVVEYLAACLQGKYQLDFAYNGEAGIEKALENVPDLIVSDVMMPIKDGFEVVETLKNDALTSHIPIVLLTAKVDVQSRMVGLSRGADAYLAKPFHQEELLITVENLLELRRKLQLKYQQFALNTTVTEVLLSADIEDSFLQKIREVIAANYPKEEFGLPQLCQKMGLSRSQLFRKMKALTDIAPSDLIRTHRLNEAKALLESGVVNVAEAAWQVGFKDSSYFSKLYQEEFGAAPSTGRK
jgi:signal transduction histidine kinase/DNA-binding response OmpR family regulator